MPNFNHKTTVVMSGRRVWWWHNCLQGHVAKLDQLLVDHRKYRDFSLGYGMKYISRESITSTTKRS
jgi:hypothetical protein